MPDPLFLLGERLLRAGVSPARVHRYITELQDHLEDLTDQIAASGLVRNVARQEARRRLGSLDALAAHMERDPRFHSPAGRWPWAVFVLAPVLALAGVSALALMALVWVAGIGDVPGWTSSATFHVQMLIGYAAPVLVTSLLLIGALRQRSRWVWPATGGGLTLLLGAAMQLSFTGKTADQGAELGLGLSQPSALVLLSLIAATTILTILSSRLWRNPAG